jgi:hypothetical protein
VTFLLKGTLIEKAAVVLLAVSCSQDVGPSDFGLFSKMKRVYIEGFKQLRTYRRTASDWF